MAPEIGGSDSGESCNDEEALSQSSSSSLSSSPPRDQAKGQAATNQARPSAVFSMASALSMIRQRKEIEDRARQEEERALEEERKAKAREKRRRRRMNQKTRRAQLKVESEGKDETGSIADSDRHQPVVTDPDVKSMDQSRSADEAEVSGDSLPVQPANASRRPGHQRTMGDNDDQEASTSAKGSKEGEGNPRKRLPVMKRLKLEVADAAAAKEKSEELQVKEETGSLFFASKVKTFIPRALLIKRRHQN